MPLVPLPQLTSLGRQRLFHATSNQLHLVGPPDPISHLRPIIYSDVPPHPPPNVTKHPYSLREFDPEPPKGTVSSEVRWKLHRQQIDDFNQRFWLDTNTRFEAAKQAVLDALPPSATPKDVENALSEFYKQWLSLEAQRMQDYTTTWRKQLFDSILLSFRVIYDKLVSRL